MTGMGRGHRLRSGKAAAKGALAMSGGGIRTLSLVLLVFLVAYVAWSGGA
ncbi:MAG: hypothetical protein U1E69_20480 [Tabrizicola sp.]|nr:hypothetical protein [Tabrizicola sp.]MDZ4089174.1 hypothetical protein [Tabrizicola sp.]